MAAFVYFWSSAYEVSGGCATDTLYPSFLRMSATFFQPEPSAKAPCTRTTFLIGCVMIILLFVLGYVQRVRTNERTTATDWLALGKRTKTLYVRAMLFRYG